MNITKGEWWASPPLNDRTTMITQDFLLAIIAWGTNVKVPEQKANAHLIAAAPDLQEALRDMVSVFERGLPPKSIGQGCCDKAHRALAKAK